MRQHVGKHRAGRFRMAVQHIVAQDLRLPRTQEGLAGFLVHIQDRTVFGTNSYGYVGPFEIITFHDRF